MIELSLVDFQAFEVKFQVGKNEHIDTVFFIFNRDAKATELAPEICEVYGQEAMSLRTVKHLFNTLATIAVLQKTTAWDNSHFFHKSTMYHR